MKNFYGIMFHHFHDDKIHKRGQGSISKDDFYKIIKFIGRDNILNADDFFHRFKENKLTDKDTCLTFDDGIKCQFDVALPVLEDLKIKSFFFIYSSLFEGQPDLLEIYRYFRMNFFKNLDQFYDNFYINLNKNLDNFFKLNNKKIKLNKIKFPFYSIRDIKFRLVRNEFLNIKEYRKIMFKMFEEKKFIPSEYYDKLFLTNKNLQKLKSLGHTVGLHSHTHPTLLESLSYKEQKNEYISNIKIISEILNINKSEIKSMSHPCGSYNNDTLKILKELGIELGFKEIMKIEPEKGMKKINNSNLEIARQDHSEIMKLMN